MGMGNLMTSTLNVNSHLLVQLDSQMDNIQTLITVDEVNDGDTVGDESNYKQYINSLNSMFKGIGN